jgi:predicted DNA-binding protein
MINKNNISIRITFNKDIANKLKILAKKEERTVSNYLNNLIKNIEEV